MTRTATVDSSDLEHAAANLQATKWRAAAGPIVERAERKSAAAAETQIRSRMGRHRRTGAMAGQVTTDVAGDGLDTVATVQARGQAARFLVGGTRAHAIVAIRALALPLHSPAGAGIRGFATSVRHPGTRPDPVVADGIRAAESEISRIHGHAADELVEATADLAKEG